jgi:membrane protein
MNEETQPSLTHRAWRFVSEGIWDVELSSLSRMRRLGVNTIRIIHLVYRGFIENECPLHASALTYSSLMAIVPILALALALLRGLDAADRLEMKILESVTAMPAQFQEMINHILVYVRNTNFTTLGGVGLALLIWLVIDVLGCVEMSFNRVWGVAAPRSLLRKISDYLSILMVVPVLIITATTINATLTSPAIINLAREWLGSAHILYSRMLSLMPFMVTWVAFIFLYKYMPNTRVNILPAVISGVAGGSLWIGWQWVYITLQVGINSYNAIYATLAAIPIFLFWLYVSWQIVLLGAEIGFALQNHATYKMEQRAHGASTRSRIMLALSIMSHAAQSMMINVPHFRVSIYARTHRVPVRLINEVLDQLVAANLLAEVAAGDGSYVLLKVPDSIRVTDIINVLIQSGASPQSLGLDRLNPAIRQVLGKEETGAAEALKDFSITDLLRLHSRLSAPTASQPTQA